MHPAIENFKVDGYTVNSTPLKAGAKVKSYDAKRKFLLKKFIPETNNIWKDMLTKYNTIMKSKVRKEYPQFIDTFGENTTPMSQDDIRCIFEKKSPLTLLSVVDTHSEEVVAVATLDIWGQDTVDIPLVLSVDPEFEFVKLITDHFIVQGYAVTISPTLGMPKLSSIYKRLGFKLKQKSEMNEGGYLEPIYEKLPPPKADKAAADKADKAKADKVKADKAKADKVKADKAKADKAKADKVKADKAKADKAAADKADKAKADKAKADKAKADKAKADKAKADKAAADKADKAKADKAKADKAAADKADKAKADKAAADKADKAKAKAADAAKLTADKAAADKAAADKAAADKAATDKAAADKAAADKAAADKAVNPHANCTKKKHCIAPANFDRCSGVTGFVPSSWV